MHEYTNIKLAARSHTDKHGTRAGLTMNFLSGEAVVGEGGVRDGDLQRRDVEGRHVVLAAALVLVVDDVFPHVVVRVRVLDLRLAPPVVHHEHQDQY